jgi:hypothetical protein
MTNTTEEIRFIVGAGYMRKWLVDNDVSPATVTRIIDILEKAVK